jgi:GTP-binding protein
MIIKTADYTSSYVDWKDCPETNLPEYAFIGRSNVGKSSLINMLTGRNKLAKVSNTPGKTQCINFFLINDNWNLVDLPGYGFAKVTKKSREKWMDATKAYMRNRKNLVFVFQLIDGRIPPQKIDIDFIEWMAENGVPFVIAYTKNDKQVKNMANIKQFEKSLLENFEELPIRFITSAEKGLGRDEVLTFIDEMNVEFAKNLKANA